MCKEENTQSAKGHRECAEEPNTGSHAPQCTLDPSIGYDLLSGFGGYFCILVARTMLQ
jgi:hypothetical protein